MKTIVSDDMYSCSCQSLPHKIHIKGFRQMEIRTRRGMFFNTTGHFLIYHPSVCTLTKLKGTKELCKNRHNLSSQKSKIQEMHVPFAPLPLPY